MRRLTTMLGNGAAVALLAGCGEGGIGQSFSLRASSPVTLIAGSYVDVDIEADCEGSIPVDLIWVDATLNAIQAPMVDDGVVLPVAGRLVCVAPNEEELGVGVRTLRLYAVDGATPGRRRLILKGTGIRDSETLDLLIDVTAPVDPEFSLAAPLQVSLATGGSTVDVPVTVVRTGLGAAIALSWQPLTLIDGRTPGPEGGVRVVAPVADGVTAASVSIEGTNVAAMIVDGTLSTILLRAHGGNTDRAVIVRLLPTIDPPDTPVDFRATPAVTSVTLAWTAAGGILTYRLERQAVSSGPWTVVSDVIGGGANGYVDNGLAPDTPYSYRLSATNVNGTSPFATLSTRTLPTPPPPGNTGWYQIGPAVSSGNEVEPQPSMLIDALGRPVVAYRETSANALGRIIVKRYNSGGFWGQMGSGQLNNGLYDAFTPSLAIDAAGVLYAAWSEYTGFSQRVYASRFPLSGGLWESVVPGNQPLDVLGAGASRPAIIVLPSGVPVVAWIQGGTVHVRTLSGGQWVEPAGGSGFTAPTAYDLRLIADGATPVIAWTEGVGATNAIKVARGTPSGGGFTFAQLGSNASLPLPAGKSSFLLFNPVVDGGVNYLVYAEGPVDFTVRARRFNAGAWEEYGNGIVPFSAQQEILSITSPSNQLVVAFSVRAVSLNGSVFGASYVGQSGWTFLTELLNPGRADAWFGLSVAMASSRSPVVAGGVIVSEKYELRVRQYIQP